METKRQLKVGRLLQRDLSELLQHELRHLAGAAMLTVTKVLPTPDLAIARVYISVFGIQDKQQVIQNLQRNTKEVRRLLGNRIRHQLRSIPELQFFLDDSLDYIDKIDDLLKGE
ncbi:MAG: 30S ribosome-binding factor RbfA [Bacteroidales bacterium]|jgi:ribosome-binding factor A|nr:30S ribosome-binding factor RbfA [Bacteroidales bacterium]MDD3700735.1 30S ribosome-binding factor RbfA [Bacteroidales bacterium]MDY0369373.1 30S ribosome-binding factor RbfA [Bacteroidales bacterium]